MKSKQALLFITTASLAANPRLVKEFAFLKQQHSCTVLCFEHQDWSAELSQKIRDAHPEVDFITIDRKKKVVATLMAKVWHKLCIFINPWFQKYVKVTAYASNDKTPQLLWEAKTLCKKTQFSTIIAHNLGAFYPAMKAAQHYGARFQLDVEDFYPGEALYFNKAHEKENRHLLMQACFDKAYSITYAAEGIAKACQEHYEISNTVKQALIINSFKSTDFKKPQAQTKSQLKCVWFSQHIGPNRGLEQVFEAAKRHPSIEFHLVGNINTAYLDSQGLSNNIILHPIMPQSILHGFLCSMDIGLALESSKADNNRDICLTNKILAYTQAGLFILATNTYGQQQFLNSLTYNAGLIITQNLAQSLTDINLQSLDLQSKTARWEAAKYFAWEVEQKQLLSLLA